MRPPWPRPTNTQLLALRRAGPFSLASPLGECRRKSPQDRTFETRYKPSIHVSWIAGLSLSGKLAVAVSLMGVRR